MRNPIWRISTVTLRMARGTASVMGLVVMLAVVLGVGTTALAAVPGEPFKLGQANVMNALTSLTGNADGEPHLQHLREAASQRSQPGDSARPARWSGER